MKKAFILICAVAFLLASCSQPRGMRNNNPLNIRHNPDNQWQGVAAAQTDKDFVMFTHRFYGYRAAAKILITYRKHGLDTPEKIITKWSPAWDGNDPEAYCRAVHARAGLEKHARVHKTDYVSLILAMASVESDVDWEDEMERELVTEAAIDAGLI